LSKGVAQHFLALFAIFFVRACEWAVFWEYQKLELCWLFDIFLQ
jgi:hypothetical protein